MKPRESNEEKKYLVDKLHAYGSQSEVMTPKEARDLVQRSGMILVPSQDMEQAFMLDQIKRQESAIFYEAYDASGIQRGS